jgi:hypothetical protein
VKIKDLRDGRAYRVWGYDSTCPMPCFLVWRDGQWGLMPCEWAVPDDVEVEA